MFQDLLDKELIDFNDKLAGETHELLKKHKFKTATAESITGGLLSAHLMAFPGASAYHLGSIVAYNTSVKIKLCGVSAKTIRAHGVVSKNVAEEMAAGVKKLTNCDIAISTTGIAGPPNDEFGKADVGKVVIAMSCPNRDISKRFKFSGSRPIIIKDTVDAALGLLRNYLKSGINNN